LLAVEVVKVGQNEDARRLLKLPVQQDPQLRAVILDHPGLEAVWDSATTLSLSRAPLLEIDAGMADSDSRTEVSLRHSEVFRGGRTTNPDFHFPEEYADLECVVWKDGNPNFYFELRSAGGGTTQVTVALGDKDLPGFFAAIAKQKPEMLDAFLRAAQIAGKQFAKQGKGGATNQTQKTRKLKSN
jgi:hypothetical protein